MKTATTASGYDAWKTAAPEADGELAEACCVCTGHEDAPPCSPACEYIASRAAMVAQVRRLRTEAKRACWRARRWDRDPTASVNLSADARWFAQDLLRKAHEVLRTMALAAERYHAEHGDDEDEDDLQAAAQ